MSAYYNEFDPYAAQWLRNLIEAGHIAPGWIFWIAPELVMDGETSDLLYAFGGTCGWMLFTFGMIIHIIKTARPTAGGR